MDAREKAGSRVPALVSSAASREDQPTAVDRLLIRRSTHVIVGLATVLLARGLGVPGLLALWAGIIAGFGGYIWMLYGIQRYIRQGLYRRALYVAREIGRRAWGSRLRAEWRINEVACLMLLGDLDEAKQLAGSVERSILSGRATHALAINLAVLYCQMFEPESALAMLDELDTSSVPRAFLPSYHLARAAAASLREDFGVAFSEVERAEAAGGMKAFKRACLHVRARIKLEADGDPQAALALSLEAMQQDVGNYCGLSGSLVCHARMVLEATGDHGQCLDILVRVFGHEAELGLSGQAEFHYVMAQCYHATGLTPEAREHLELARERPCTGRLRARMQQLAEQLASNLGPHEPVPTG